VQPIQKQETMNRIKEILHQQGRSQTWLAEQIGRSYVVTTNYCNNKTQPSIHLLRKIAQVLDVDVRELLLETKGMNIIGVILRHCYPKNRKEISRLSFR
jgi:putative transcriptional regulator